MGQHEAQAGRVLEAVLRARAANPVEPQPRKSVDQEYAEDQMRPIREFMLDVGHCLSTARAHASVVAGPVRTDIPMIRDESYLLTNNYGLPRHIRFRFAIHQPGTLPKLMIGDWDDEADREFQALAQDGVVTTFRFEAIIQVLERYLVRFLTGPGGMPSTSVQA